MNFALGGVGMGGTSNCLLDERKNRIILPFFFFSCDRRISKRILCKATITGKQSVDAFFLRVWASLSVCTLNSIVWLWGPERLDRLSKPACVHVVLPVSPGSSATYRGCGPYRSLSAYVFSSSGWILHGTTLIVTYVCGSEGNQKWLGTKKLENFSFVLLFWRCFEWFFFSFYKSTFNKLLWYKEVLISRYRLIRVVF